MEEDDIAQAWTDFINFFPQATFIEWDKKDLIDQVESIG